MDEWREMCLSKIRILVNIQKILLLSLNSELVGVQKISARSVPLTSNFGNSSYEKNSGLSLGFFCIIKIYSLY